MQPTIKKRYPLTVLPQSQRNLGLDFQNLKSKYENFIIAKGKYFPYNMCVADAKWGCAWRSIQMFLSFYKDIDTFQDLFDKYRSKSQLMKIITKNQLYSSQVVKKLQQKKWAPEVHSQNWAQPFICHLIAIDKKIKSKLVLINGYPEIANAPSDVFQETLTFTEFSKILSTHFEDYGPIMIDDGKLAMTIVGFSHDKQQNIYKILMGDPHIKQNQSYKLMGIYEIHLDENGKQIKYVIIKDQVEGILFQGFKVLQFSNKKWMVTIGN